MSTDVRCSPRKHIVGASDSYPRLKFQPISSSAPSPLGQDYPQQRPTFIATPSLPAHLDIKCTISSSVSSNAAHPSLSASVTTRRAQSADPPLVGHSLNGNEAPKIWQRLSEKGMLGNGCCMNSPVEQSRDISVCQIVVERYLEYKPNSTPKSGRPRLV